MEELEEPPNKSQKSYSSKSTVWESIRMGKYPERVLAHLKKPHITQNPRQFLLGKPRAEKSASSLRNFALFILIEPPYTEPYVRWCERSGVNHSLLLDSAQLFFKYLFEKSILRLEKRNLQYLGRC